MKGAFSLKQVIKMHLLFRYNFTEIAVVRYADDAAAMKKLAVSRIAFSESHVLTKVVFGTGRLRKSLTEYVA